MVWYILNVSHLESFKFREWEKWSYFEDDDGDGDDNDENVNDYNDDVEHNESGNNIKHLMTSPEGNN